MLSQTMQKALNDQLNREASSFYIYLSMAQYCESINLRGFAHWFNVQAREEMAHAMKFIAYINDRNGRVSLEKIDKPQSEWSGPLNVFEEAYKHEQFITKNIHELANLAGKEGDHATASFLRWFVDEQVEEEAHALENVEILKMVGDAKHAVFMMDRQLANRKAN